jgi:hypothetical protein
VSNGGITMLRRQASPALAPGWIGSSGVAQRPAAPARRRASWNSEASFVELSGAQMLGVPRVGGAGVELTDAHGGRPAVRLGAGTPLDVACLVETLLRCECSWRSTPAGVVVTWAVWRSAAEQWCTRRDGGCADGWSPDRDRRARRPPQERASPPAAPPSNAGDLRRSLGDRGRRSSGQNQGAPWRRADLCGVETDQTSGCLFDLSCNALTLTESHC